MTFLTFFISLVLIVGVGVLSFTKSKPGNNTDYYLAGQDVKPVVVALSAVATNNSGYMFMGMIGLTYAVGLESAWLMFGWILGDMITSFFVHKKVRKVTEEESLVSYPGVLSKWGGNDFLVFRFVSGVIVLAFLCVYAAAQMLAGAKALHMVFAWDVNTGVALSAFVILVYCVVGGMRASIWTDVIQSIFMIVAMAILCVVGIVYLGGANATMAALQSVPNGFMSPMPSYGIGSSIVFVLGWVIAGIGVIGQPHIMVRFMSVQCSSQMRDTMIYYYLFYVAFAIMTIFVGLLSRVIVTEGFLLDPELSLPFLAGLLLNGAFLGVILAAIFSASMSTADSQIIICSAALCKDVNLDKVVRLGKVATLACVAVSFLVALFGDDNVFTLALISWATLGSCFAPILISHILGWNLSELECVAMSLIGVASVALWNLFGADALGLDVIVYPGLPGSMAVFAFLLLNRLLRVLYRYFKHKPNISL